ncbi:putative membrane protein [Wickerhamomyces ciferrii]|uniref:Membrane protein n=1 Tax=Wickerhamomyces ciferrii (strain ATCC 14091 / BCRC 22168 / CBS 111 / JCM 3599 / NBRC 0793 / NRRL Y-1031 F-60-10) TaxID=1206466 RepID=K0KSL4_WICCF|nr:uncharacterized protein BN7_5739 [Wickerhamomyces ciferrii]CCH46151.1 putative membrane protein [Wickerhamomyces ciferrii]
MRLFKKRESVESLEPKEEIESTTTSDVESVKPISAKKGSPIVKAIIGSKPAPIVQEESTYPYLTANIFSKITFHWVSPIIKKGYLRRIEDEDLWKLEGDLTVRSMTERFEANLEKRIEQWRSKNPDKEQFTKIVVIKAINDTFFRRFWIGGFSKFLADISMVLTPLLVRALIKIIQNKGDGKVVPHVGHAIGIAIGISLMMIFSSLMICSTFHLSMLTGAQCKALLTNIIYRKAFKLSSKAKLKYPNGKVNSLVMSDLSRIDMAMGMFHFIWTFPITMIVVLIVLVCNLGPPGLIAIGLILVLVAFMFYVTSKLKLWRRQSTKFIDSRVRSINEIINSLKMIKFYCWEKPYYNAVEQYRTKEKGFILKIQLLKAILNTCVSMVPILGTMLVFLTMFKTSSGFVSYNIFSAVTLLNTLRFPLNILPMAVGFLVDALLAMERFADFLQAEESEETVQRLGYDDSENAIEISNATFKWDVEEIEEQKVKPEKQTTEDNKGEDLSFPGLLDLDLNIKKNELIIVTGSIGTGKSSLLSAIEGSMRKESGESKIYGSLTFCSYPWIQNETIRENILFGSPFIREKYYSIVKACALDVDFQVLPDGDQTEVGERGITLSGGQKARINLARAVYADNDIILLDDVLSAVDARVGKHIMNECICGILKDKTRVLATHQLSLIGSSDRIIVLDGSGSIDIGTYSQLLTRNATFAKLMEFSKEESDEEENEDDEKSIMEEEEQTALERQKTEISKIQSRRQENESSTTEKGRITTNEQRGTDSISMKIYANYMKLGSGPFGYAIIPIFMLILAMNGFLQLFHSVWLTFWLSHKFDISTNAYIGIYIMFVFLAIGSYALLFTTMGALNNNAGLHLFNLSAKKLLKTPMWFMDITPIGRILNRFTKDVDVLDTDLIEQLRLFIQSIALVGGVVILCGVYIPWFFLILPFAFGVFYYLSHYYQSSALDIKRLESIKRSFVFSHFNESLTGMRVIKSYGSQERFKQRYEKLIDDMDSAYFVTLANQRWLGVRLDAVGSLISLFVAILCSCGVFNMNGAQSGLLVSYIIQIASIMSLLLRSMTQVENDMNSVERLYEYATKLPEEGPFEVEDKKPEKSWPKNGEIQFNDVSLNYRAGLPLVLKNVSFNVKGGEKIGICGRTGAGKSTVMNALFRVNELIGGNVVIDDVDISQIGLDDLRSKLSIIPQDPVLFHGSIRQNLDPFGKSPDIELWDALKRSWLVEEGASGTGKFIAGETDIKSFHKFHLDQNVEDDGANFSLGERQLLALARALVRNTRILILDEATSSVDYETDAKIQSTIINEFKQCTILCIAHRLKTILNYDKILVLDKGEVMEFDTPWNLFKYGGIFTEMCERSSITEEDFEGLKK